MSTQARNSRQELGLKQGREQSSKQEQDCGSTFNMEKRSDPEYFQFADDDTMEGIVVCIECAKDGKRPFRISCSAEWDPESNSISQVDLRLLQRFASLTWGSHPQGDVTVMFEVAQ